MSEMMFGVTSVCQNLWGHMFSSYSVFRQQSDSDAIRQAERV